jgi:hypothetical protein
MIGALNIVIGTQHVGDGLIHLDVDRLPPAQGRSQCIE